MLSDLDESLKQLLVRMGELDPAEVDISFDIPTREWSTPVTKPTVNLYLYDIRENRDLRETYWEQEYREDGSVDLRRGPIRLDVAYMLTCWTSQTYDQHLLLWRVLETFFRYSPLPEDVLQGVLVQNSHPIRTQVAQPDGILRNVSDFWGALENQLRPAVSLVVTVDLDLRQIVTAPLVFARVAKLGRLATDPAGESAARRLRRLEADWEVAPVRVAGEVFDAEGKPLAAASLRLIGLRNGQPVQMYSTVESNAAGRYVFDAVAPGDYTLVVEVGGREPQQQPLTVAVGERGEAVPVLRHRVEVAMTAG